MWFTLQLRLDLLVLWFIEDKVSESLAFFNSLPTQQPHQFIWKCLSGSQPTRHSSTFISLRVQLLLGAAAEETAKTLATEAQMLQPSHSSPPAEPLAA